MVDTISEQPSIRRAPLETVMKNIERYCGSGPDGPQSVTLFNVVTPQRENRERQAEYAANTVYDGMMYTLSEIGAYAVEKAKERKGRASGTEYEKVARALESLTAVCRSLADDQIPLQRNVGLERMLEEEGDKAYAYKARDVEIEGKRYKEVRVFIRPQKFERALHTRRERAGARISEVAQARMSIEAIPLDSRDSRLHIRTDREDALHDFKITYDIEIGERDDNVMDRLDFSDSGISKVATGQRETHHFSSELKAEDFGVSFSDILEAANNKFSRNVESQSSSPS
jgi:hypothetical protein